MMKKLPVVLLIVSLAFWSCKCDCDKSTAKAGDSTGAARLLAAKLLVDPPEAMPAAKDTDSISLNGISKKNVIQGIKVFENKSYYRVSPLPQYSVWFDKKTVIEMYNLLSEEITHTPAGAGKPDGFRIYFLGNKTPNTPNFAVVSTRDGGADRTGRHKHLDYYKHDISKPLFNLGAQIQGTISTDDSGGNARLYKPCSGSDCDLSCTASGADIVRVATAETLAQYDKTLIFNTKSVWFEFDLLRKFYQIFKNDTTISGVRVYLINYGNIPQSTVKNLRFTFLLTPTTDVDGVHRDVYSCLISKAWHLQQIDDDDSNAGYNSGELCPHHCNDEDGGDTSKVVKAALIK